MKFINIVCTLFALTLPHHLCGAKKQPPKETKRATFINDTKEEKETKDEFVFTKELCAELSPLHTDLSLYQALKDGDTLTIKAMLNDPLVYKHMNFGMFIAVLQFAFKKNNDEIPKIIFNNKRWQILIDKEKKIVSLLFKSILTILVNKGLHDSLRIFLSHDFHLKYLRRESIKIAREIVRDKDDANSRIIFMDLTYALSDIQYAFLVRIF